MLASNTEVTRLYFSKNMLLTMPIANGMMKAASPSVSACQRMRFMCCMSISRLARNMM